MEIDIDDVEERKPKDNRCGCNSWQPVLTKCKNCDEKYCRRCIQDHRCLCGTHFSESNIFCYDCGMICASCLRYHECTCIVCGKNEAQTVCRTCNLVMCDDCLSEHFCLCDCGSGAAGTPCRQCRMLYCPSCITVRHECDCTCQRGAKKPRKIRNKICTSANEIFCAACFPDHHCTCYCNGREIAHCRHCGHSFCAACCNAPWHACPCSNCGQKAKRLVCELCNRMFCPGCINSHSCSCDNEKCKSRSYDSKSSRRYCTKCLRLYCKGCLRNHGCVGNCQGEENCQGKVLYKCACKAELCADHLGAHQCMMESIRLIRQERETTMEYEENQHTQPCEEKICQCSARIATWNMNHISKTTKTFKKGGKISIIKNICLNSSAAIDILGLQEVNSTATEVLNNLGDELTVLKWGPLLVSQSPEGRLQFVKSFKATKPSKWSTVPDIAERQKTFYQDLNLNTGLKKKYADWCQAVNAAKDNLKSTSKLTRDAAITKLQEEHPDGEKIYQQRSVSRKRYQEFYPLVGRKDAGIQVDDTIYLLWGDGSVTEATNKQVVIFRGQVDDGNSEEDDETDEPTRFRPVVTYRIRKQCNAPNCQGFEFYLGLVHTSPAQNQFNRVQIYNEQLKKAFETVMQYPGHWIIAGDYYLAPEAIVTVPGKKNNLPRYSNANRNTLKITFQEQLPHGLEIVAAISGTNAGTWKPEKDLFDSSNMQIADFAVCTSNWPLRRAFSIHPDSGRPMILDENHEAFQVMKGEDTSDHSPVLIFAGRDEAQGTRELKAMLGYGERTDMKVIEEMEKYAQAKNEQEPLLEELKQKREKVERKLREHDGTMRKYLLRVQRHRRCVERIVNISQRPQGVSLLDFVPVKEFRLEEDEVD